MKTDTETREKIKLILDEANENYPYSNALDDTGFSSKGLMKTLEDSLKGGVKFKFIKYEGTSRCIKCSKAAIYEQVFDDKFITGVFKGFIGIDRVFCESCATLEEISK